MDCSIIVVAPERARSGKKRPASAVIGAKLRSGSLAAHRWLSARDDLNTCRLCGGLFLLGIFLAACSSTSFMGLEVFCDRT